jgi:protein-tyrosine-phosphatase
VSRPGDNGVFEVVFVCTANRARSALGEAFYRRHTLGFDTLARSFGTLDLRDAPPLEHAVDAGRRLGVDLTSHTASPLSPGALAEADLVLGFEPHHVAAAVVDSAAVPGRTFLLRELVKLLSPVARADGSVQHARTEVAAADQRRSTSRRDAARFGIADPAGQPPRVMLATATEIDELVRRLVRSLFGHSSRG